ncbi:hypothetical protein Tco_0945223, partial [Tanacetum coccineum]
QHVAREKDPQRQVARDTTDLSLGNMENVVVVLAPSPDACWSGIFSRYVWNYCFDFWTFL